MSTTTNIKPFTQRPAWKALTAHHGKIKKPHLRKLFEDDPKRGERMTAEAAGLFFDYSNGRTTDQTSEQPDPSLPKIEGGQMKTPGRIHFQRAVPLQ